MGRKEGMKRRKDNQQAGATKAGIHDLTSQSITGRGRNEKPTGGQNIGKDERGGGKKGVKNRKTEV